MKTVTQKEAFDLYDKLTDLAHGMAAALNTTPDLCQDSICQRWRKFDGIDEMEDDMLLLLTDEDNPLFILYHYHEDKTNMIGGIMSVKKEDGFKNVYRDGKKLYLEYTDETWECYQALESFKDVYYIHSTNRKPVYGIMINKN
jgi:hypothetical protein